VRKPHFTLKKAPYCVHNLLLQKSTPEVCVKTSFDANPDELLHDSCDQTTNQSPLTELPPVDTDFLSSEFRINYELMPNIPDFSKEDFENLFL
jgi:hypothetical protein